jgi:hypothetical protein
MRFNSFWIGVMDIVLCLGALLRKATVLLFRIPSIASLFFHLCVRMYLGSVLMRMSPPALTETSPVRIR